MPITEKRAAEMAGQLERGEIELTDLPEDQWPEVTKRGRGRPSLGASGKSPQITIRVTPELRDLAAARAEAEGVKVSELTRRALEQYLTRRPRGRGHRAS